MTFDFTIKEKLSSEFILSKISEESIFRYYLGIDLKKGLFCSTLRSDKNPTCSIFRNSKGVLIFKDFATGQYLDCWNIVMYKYNCTYFQALEIVANDFGLIKSDIKKNKGKIDLQIPKIEDKETSKIQVEIQEFTDLELKWWSKYGITKEILNKFKVYSCKHIFLNNNLFAESKQHCPIFGYYGNKYHGLELWRIYFPKRKNYRFITNWPAKKLQGYDQLPKKGNLLVITKSMKDCLSMYSCGITAIAPCSENLFVSKSILEDLKKRFKYIVVFYDNDIPGINNMRKIKKDYPDLNYFFIPRKYEAKDFSDFYKKYGRSKTLSIIKDYVLELRLKGTKNYG